MSHDLLFQSKGLKICYIYSLLLALIVDERLDRATGITNESCIRANMPTNKERNVMIQV